MPPKAAAKKSAANATAERFQRVRADFVKLERRLVLAAWLNHLLGYKDNREMLRDVKGQPERPEGFDAQGRSYIYHHLISRGEQIDRQALATYDDNIKRHLDAMNRHRRKPIRLRYFQYLAVLFAEIFLDRWFNQRLTLVADLNRFVDQRNASLPAGNAPYPSFEEADLDKLAFWMATGGGKTLIMHFNYRQFLHYNRQPLDNILLITPNEGMTEQHLDEMIDSGVPCGRFQNSETGLGLVGRDVVRVIDIHKLVEEKKGSGVSVPVEAFEGNNLIFVDEAHMGATGEQWRDLRQKLGAAGFTFEYSATFREALATARNDPLAEQYSRQIIFNYSYPHFYEDGFGKDFRILNLRGGTSARMTDTLLLANVLSFYQQQRCYREHSALIAPYNLEAPLWIFIGRSVNAIYVQDGREQSDVLAVARFLQRFLRNKDGWATADIDRLLAGESGLRDPEGNDLFDGRFAYLRETDTDASALHHDILRLLFNTDSSAGLHMAPIRANQGELGLRAGPDADYFGLVYVGDAAAFRKLVEGDDSGITVEPEDVLRESLFDSINDAQSPVNVLIGAKKFIAGWSSWRVSHMGLLNIGRSEGPEIMQLFGRGVRLRGKDFSLKRSRELAGDHPRYLPLLETLDIFAVRADYMGEFRRKLEEEGIDTEGSVEIPLPIRTQKEFLRKGLLTLRLPTGKESAFVDECAFLLEPDEAVRADVNLSPRVEAISSTQGGLRTTSAQAGKPTRLEAKHLDLLDWEGIYLDLLDHKERRGYHNLAIPRESLRRIIEAEDPTMYSLAAPEAVANPETFAGLAETRRAVQAILREYVDELFAARRKRWEDENLRLVRLTRNDGNLQERQYRVKVPRSDRELIGQVEELIRDVEGLYKEWRRAFLRNVYFDQHIYQPLLALISKETALQVEPQGLEESAQKFVETVKAYLDKHSSEMPRSKIFLLRNQSRGRGVGFYGKQGSHYPDFILWITNGGRQRIVFVEPHGMLHEDAPGVNDKLKLPARLKRLEAELNRDRKGVSVQLDYFIISTTPHEHLRPKWYDGDWDKARFAAAHILFAEDDYLSGLFLA